MDARMAMSAMSHMFHMPKIVVSTKGTIKNIQFRFPRSKSKRIRKKFTKDKENFKIEYINLSLFDKFTGQSIIVVHPMVAQYLRGI